MGASTARPVSASHAVLGVPMRRGMLTVPLTGHQAHGDLGQSEGRVRIGDDPVAEGRQLRPGPDAVAVDAGGDPVSHDGQGPGGQPLEAHGVGGGRVGGGAELPEVAPAAERGARALEHGGERRVGSHQLQPLDEGVAQGHVDGVVHLGPGQGDRQAVALPPQSQRIRRRDRRGRPPFDQPAGELRAALQPGVGG